MAEFDGMDLMAEFDGADLMAKFDGMDSMAKFIDLPVTNLTYSPFYPPILAVNRLRTNFNAKQRVS